MGHQIHFMFGSRVGFWGTADRMALFPVLPNPRGGCMPSWKISNKYKPISGMRYPIHFHEISFAGWDGIMREV